MLDDQPHVSIDASELWRLQEVADAATEMRFEEQSPRLRAALANLKLRPASDRSDV